MRSQARKLLEQALALPEEDRLLIATELRDSIAVVESPEEIDDALRDEIVRRVQRVDSGEAMLLDGNDVYQRLRAKYDR
ncbi:MAG TPA: addiction module protein [Polyangiales bacterium]